MIADILPHADLAQADTKSALLCLCETLIGLCWQKAQLQTIRLITLTQFVSVIDSVKYILVYCV